MTTASGSMTVNPVIEPDAPEVPPGSSLADEGDDMKFASTLKMTLGSGNDTTNIPRALNEKPVSSAVPTTAPSPRAH